MVSECWFQHPAGVVRTLASPFTGWAALPPVPTPVRQLVERTDEDNMTEVRGRVPRSC